MTQMQNKTIPLPTPLPAHWMRLRPTKSDTTERPSPNLCRVGSQHAFRGTLIDLIEHAKEVVLISSFLFSDTKLKDALLAAVGRGCRVYALSASENQLNKMPKEEEEFEQRMLEEHKSFLNDLAGKVLLRSADHFHAKFLVCDPNTSEAQGWLSTANFNKALEESVELGVRLLPPQTKQLTEMFAWAFWMEAEKELLEKGKLSSPKRLSDEPNRPCPSHQHPLYFTTKTVEKNLGKKVDEIVQGARKRLWIASYGWEVSHSTIHKIEQKARDGVDVRIFTRPRPANKEAMDKLAKAGAKIYAHDKLHAKAILSEKEGLVMTANLSKHGLDEGFEVGIVLDKETQQTLKSTFEEWKDQFPWEYRLEGDRNQKEEGELCFAEQSLRDGRRELLLEKIVRLPPMELPSPEKQQTTEPNESMFKPHLRDTDKKCYHRIRFEWEVLPPKAQTDPPTKEKKKKQQKGKA